MRSPRALLTSACPSVSPGTSGPRHSWVLSEHPAPGQRPQLSTGKSPGQVFRRGWPPAA